MQGNYLQNYQVFASQYFVSASCAPVAACSVHYVDNYAGIIMVALCNRADHYIFALWFLSSFFFFFLA